MIHACKKDLENFSLSTKVLNFSLATVVVVSLMDNISDDDPTGAHNAYEILF